ncbi:MAG: glutamate formimidoyltransferase [Longimicrobiales bacterium]|nr:glutamate formimidoyltransferase [Longimicrobiales bacterium]
MIPILEAVPNFSEGRDRTVVDALVDAIEAHDVDVLDVSMDPDHHRSVITFIGMPRAVEEALVAAAEVAIERIDLRRHEGVHPRLGALDVCPVVPLHGLDMSDAVRSAHRVGAGIAELGVPVFWYGAAAREPGSGLAPLRRGGFEAFAGGWPTGRTPDLDAGRSAAHPTAGITCVGARPVLLAWNVWVDEIERETLVDIAREIRERDGGMPGLRALALELPRQGGLQLSMNLEGVQARDPFDVFLRVERRVTANGGRITKTEVIGMIPDTLVFPAATHRLRLSDPDPVRMLSSRVQRYALERMESELQTMVDWILGAGSEVPNDIRDAARLVAGRSTPQSTAEDA